MEISNLIRKNVLKMKAYRSAREEFQGQAAIFLDANENPFDSSINRYPDPNQLILKKMISSSKHVKTNQLILGNGSDELIDLLMRAFCEPGYDAIRILNPTYGMYEVCADLNNIEIIRTPLDALFGLDPNLKNTPWQPNEKLFFLCSPNNPSGNNLDKKTMEDIVKNYPGIVVIDEAYIDFTEQESMLSEISNSNNLFILQTFSKALGAAGIRIGMGFGNSEIIDVLQKIKPPYNISTLAQNEAVKVWKKNQIAHEDINTIKRERGILYKALQQLSFVKQVFKSDANFILARVENEIALYDFLKDNGIICRKRGNLYLCENCLRFTVGTPEENKLLFETLKKFNP